MLTIVLLVLLIAVVVAALNGFGGSRI